jgi:serine/threonine protein kinase
VHEKNLDDTFVFGTRIFMAPEIGTFISSDYNIKNPKSLDIWSLGITIAILYSKEVRHKLNVLIDLKKKK